jgi:AcrR family transcriptional regulator
VGNVPAQNKVEVAPETSRRERILVEAERLFATKGLHAASMRDIATAAEVGLPLIVYHFESKQRLYLEVFARRADVNEARLARLATIEDRTADDAVDRIVAAFVDPVLDLHERPADKFYARLILREITDPTSAERPEISRLFDPVASSFISALRDALPDKPAGYHEWAYLFTVGALSMSAFDDRIVEGRDERAQTAMPIKRNFLHRYVGSALRFG